MDEETGLPIVSFDYELLEGKAAVIIAKDHAAGAFLAYTCTEKGLANKWVVKQFIRDLCDWGRKDICLKTDGEPAMIALHTAVADARSSRTVPRNPPAYNPQSNGSVEKAVQDMAGLMRRLTPALEARLQQKIFEKLQIRRFHAAQNLANTLTQFLNQCCLTTGRVP